MRPKNYAAFSAADKMKPGRNARGVALYMAVVIMSILFSISFGMSSLSIARLKNLNSIGNSVVAFYAADVGAEQSAYDAVQLGLGSAAYTIPLTYLDTNNNGVEDEGDATYEVYGVLGGVNECPAAYQYCLKCTGKYMGTKRTITLQFP